MTTWDLDDLRQTISTDGPSVAARLGAARGVDETFQAALDAVDLHALAAAEAYADVTDPAAGERYRFAETTVAPALARAAGRLSEADRAEGPAGRWLAGLRLQRPPSLGGRADDVEHALAAHGVHAWSLRWQRIVGALQAAAPRLGPVVRLEERAERLRAHQERLAPHLGDLAEVATHVLGHKLALAELRAQDPLAAALTANVVRRETVEAILAACRAARPALHRYVRARATWLGVPPDAPVPVGVQHHPLPGSPGTVPFSEALDRVVGAFEGGSPAFARFARRAADRRWIDAERRPTKRPVATCFHFSRARASRVSFGYAEDAASVVTLAHELGHAWHAEVLLREGPAPIEVPRSLAECASLVAEGWARPVAAETDPVAVLDGFLSGAYKYLVDGACTVAVEGAMFDLRRHGPVGPAALAAAVSALQVEWFGREAEACDPTAWASQFLYYQPGPPFGALPYVVAWMVATRVLAVARERGPAFAPAWEHLLADAQVCTVEEVVSRHLGLDATAPETWRAVVSDVEAQALAFEALCGTGRKPLEPARLPR